MFFLFHHLDFLMNIVLYSLLSHFYISQSFSAKNITKSIHFLISYRKNAHIHGTRHEHKRFILSQYVILTL